MSGVCVSIGGGGQGFYKQKLKMKIFIAGAQSPSGGHQQEMLIVSLPNGSM